MKKDEGKGEISIMKMKSRHMCLKCGAELKNFQMGDSLFSSMRGDSGAHYCDNNGCEHFGVLTIGYKPLTTIVEKEEKEKEHENTIAQKEV